MADDDLDLDQLDAHARSARKSPEDWAMDYGIDVPKLVARIREMEEGAEEGDTLRAKLADLLSRTAVALNGPEPELTMWSWHDLPEKAKNAMDVIERLMAREQELWDRESLAMRQRDAAEAAIARVRTIDAADAATTSRDYGRGYAQALRDVHEALEKTDG